MALVAGQSQLLLADNSSYSSTFQCFREDFLTLLKEQEILKYTESLCKSWFLLV